MIRGLNGCEVNHFKICFYNFNFIISYSLDKTLLYCTCFHLQSVLMLFVEYPCSMDRFSLTSYVPKRWSHASIASSFMASREQNVPSPLPDRAPRQQRTSRVFTKMFWNAHKKENKIMVTQRDDPVKGLLSVTDEIKVRCNKSRYY